MTKQTEFANSLVGSPAGVRISRLCTLTIAAVLAIGGAVSGFGQQPQADFARTSSEAGSTRKKGTCPAG